MEQKCLRCKKRLFGLNVLDTKGHLAMDPNSALPLESEGADKFFRCPHCGAKNLIIETASKDGVPQIKISLIKD